MGIIIHKFTMITRCSINNLPHIQKKVYELLNDIIIDHVKVSTGRHAVNNIYKFKHYWNIAQNITTQKLNTINLNKGQTDCMQMIINWFTQIIINTG